MLPDHARRGDASTLDRDLAALRAALHRRGSWPRFRTALLAELRVTEELRSATDPRSFVANIEEEGRLTVEMALAVMGPHANAGLTRFLISIAELGNVVDKIADARGDFERGEISIRPEPRLYLRLVRAAIPRIHGVLDSHPSAARLGAWAWSLLAPMVVARKQSGF